MEWGTPQSQMTFYTMTLCHAEGLLLRRMSSMAKGCWDKWKQKELQGHRDCKPNYNNGSLPSTYAQMRKRLLSVQEEDSQVADSSINFRLLTLCLYQISHLNIKYFFLLHNSQQSLTHTQPPSCGRKTPVCVCVHACAHAHPGPLSLPTILSTEILWCMPRHTLGRYSAQPVTWHQLFCQCHKDSHKHWVHCILHIFENT